jgi:methionyl-tRNA formyltransferase
MSINKGKLRIVFMGTPAFAVHILDGLVQKEYNIVGVVTAPDRPAGRGQKIKQSAVKVYANKHQLKVFQPENLKDREFLQQLQNVKADVQVVVAFRMLPKVVWQMPKKGTFNLHASLLPQYRGAAPINWAIINGEKETGVSTFFIDEKIDTGALIFQSKISISAADNAGTLHDKLMIEGLLLTLRTLNAIGDNQFETTQQKAVSNLKTAHKLNKENCKIDWSKSGCQIINHVRGLNPYPSAWTLLQNGNDLINLKLYEVQFEKITHQLEIGKVFIDKYSIKVATRDGFIDLTSFKFPGKKQMDVKSFLNGFSFDTEAKMV